jgi:hypothetical protein
MCGTPLVSSGAVLNVNQPPSITSQPESVTVCQGSSTAFSAGIDNATSYQWQVNTGSGFVNLSEGGAHSGVNTATLSITGAAPTMNGYQYRLVAMSSCPPSVISNAVTLGVNSQTLITAAPVGATKCVGEPVVFNVAATGTDLNYQWKKNGNNIAGATNSTYSIASASLADAGSYTVQVSGDCGAPIVASGAVLTVDQLPAITSQPVNKGICTGASTFFSVAANNATAYQWQVNSGSGSFTNLTNEGVYSGVTTATLGITGAPASMNGYQYRAVATGLCTPAATSNTATLNVSVPTALGEFTVLTAPVLINTAVNMSISFTGVAPATAVWNWDDGSTSNGVVGSTSITGSHVYTVQGVYMPTLTITNCGTSVSKSYMYVVVYDPNGGFITGGGWVNSPAGAYLSQPFSSGRANFGFVSKYRKGATTPDGNTEFQYHAGNLIFNSTAYEWLVIAGAKGQYKGSGTINGTGNYGFILTAVDGGSYPDRLRIKIWDKVSGVLVYDNQLGASDTADPATLIAGGSIIVHKGGKTAREGAVVAETVTLSGNKLRAYPNPFTGKTTIEFAFDREEEYALEIYNLQGRLVSSLGAARTEAGKLNQVTWEPKTALRGVYFARLTTKSGVQHIKLVVR